MKKVVIIIGVILIGLVSFLGINSGKDVSVIRDSTLESKKYYSVVYNKDNKNDIKDKISKDLYNTKNGHTMYKIRESSYILTEEEQIGISNSILKDGIYKKVVFLMSDEFSSREEWEKNVMAKAEERKAEEVAREKERVKLEEEKIIEENQEIIQENFEISTNGISYYIANVNSKIYHLTPTCSGMKSAIEIKIIDGLRPCGKRSGCN